MNRALALLAVLPLAAHAFQNEPEGFRGLAWGTEYETVREMFHPHSPPGTDGRLTLRRKDDKLQIGGANLATILYAFAQGKFAFVYLRAAGAAKDNHELINAFTAQFGPVDRLNPGLDAWQWKGDSSHIRLTCDPAKPCTAQILSAAHMAAEIAAIRQRAKDAKKDF